MFLNRVNHRVNFLEKERKSLSCPQFRTGDEGIEPPPKVLETPIIPLDQSPMCLNHTRYLYHIIYRFVKCQIVLAPDFFRLFIY